MICFPPGNAYSSSVKILRVRMVKPRLDRIRRSLLMVCSVRNAVLLETCSADIVLCNLDKRQVFPIRKQTLKVPDNG